MTAIIALLLFGIPLAVVLGLTHLDRHADYWKQFGRELPEMHYLGYQDKPEVFE